MHIAIIGAGFSGLATAWHLLQHPHFKVTLFDPAGIGGGASGIAAGLMHPYAGLHAKLNRQGIEGMEASTRLLEIAKTALGKPVADFSGLFRPATSSDQIQDYLKCAEKYADVEWWNASQSQDMCKSLLPLEGIFIKSAVTVNCALYLKGLWAACQRLGAILESVKIDDLNQLDAFDAVVVATGASARSLLTDLPISAVKGQVLELHWPENLPLLPFPVNSQAYVVMSPDLKSCFVGATYERNFISLDPVPEVAIADILPKLAAFMPVLERAKVLNCFAGVRASTADHLPIAQRVNERCWVLSGMGSKGLLYHALYAEKISKQIIEY